MPAGSAYAGSFEGFSEDEYHKFCSAMYPPMRLCSCNCCNKGKFCPNLTLSSQGLVIFLQNDMDFQLGNFFDQSLTMLALNNSLMND